ncbi:hypothetical protein [Bifidobacterium myosotis]|uniref:Uncharacterized protein n=1 Tax=Bifidobacterium myosotis TaxID=1630166 RepID=A0A5M9ZHM5_9BIFI|nr:hypothetical protein [Bifidobacterium myosotis]KAA8825098.1 hypothetical protein EMO91_12785 [Bifidobacterium myosotis]
MAPPAPRRRAAAGSFADFARTLPNLASYRRDGDTATLGFDDGRTLTVAHAGGATTFTLADAEGRIIYRSTQHPEDCPPRYRRSTLRRMTKRLASRTEGFMPEPDLADQRTLADGTVLTVDDTAYGFVLEVSDADGRTLHRGEYRRERYGRYGAYLAARREALDRAQHAIEKGGPELLKSREWSRLNPPAPKTRDEAELARARDRHRDWLRRQAEGPAERRFAYYCAECGRPVDKGTGSRGLCGTCSRRARRREARAAQAAR